MRLAAPSPKPMHGAADRGCAVDRGDRLLYRRTRRGVPPVSGAFCSRRDRHPRTPGPDRLRAHLAAAARARAARPDPPHPWRPASRQHRAHRRQAGSVRCHRVQRHHCLGRRSLRSRLPADGPARARFGAAGERRAQPLPRADARGRRPRWACSLAVLPLAARRDPRHGHGRADGTRAQRRAATPSPSRRAPTSPSRSAPSRRRRQNLSPSAASPAPANRGSPGC